MRARHAGWMAACVFSASVAGCVWSAGIAVEWPLGGVAVAAVVLAGLCLAVALTVDALRYARQARVELYWEEERGIRMAPGALKGGLQ
jgi:uncharacterized protein (DUF58 family)